MKTGADPLSIYGSHRVIEPKKSLPQSALRLDNRPKILNPHELLLDVDFLMLDATSMREIRDFCSSYPDLMTAKILEIIQERGKMHNPVTNSGGVLVGRIREIGKQFFEVHPAVPGGDTPGQIII